jgi:hypothetical protein
VFWFDQEVAKSLRGLHSKVQNLLAIGSEWNLHGSRNTITSREPLLDFSANFRTDVVPSRKLVQKCVIFAQQSEKQMFRLNVVASVVARLVASKEDDAAGFLCNART